MVISTQKSFDWRHSYCSELILAFAQFCFQGVDSILLLLHDAG